MRALSPAIGTACVLGVVACTAPALRPATTSTITSVATHTRPPPTTVTPLAEGPTTTHDGTCPFIGKQRAADTEGNRIGRVAVLTRQGHPVGCQFFFDPHWGAPRMVLEITSARYANADLARDAMVRAGENGHDAFGVAVLAPGIAAVLYRAQFYPPDRGQDWACSFAKASTVVTVKTDQTNTSDDARNAALDIAAGFPTAP